MPFQFSQQTTDLVNQTLQDVTQHVAEGTSNLPSNVQEKVIENAFFKYYQQREAERKANRGRTAHSYLRDSVANNVANPVEYSNEELTAARNRVAELQEQVDRLTAANNSRYVSEAYKSQNKAELENKQSALALAQQQQERMERDTARARQATQRKVVDEAAERGVSYKDQSEAYGQSLKEMYEQREQLRQQLTGLDKKYSRANSDLDFETRKRMYDEEKESTTDRLEKLEREIERIEGQQNYASLNFGKDKNAAVVIKQGEELARILKDQYLAGNIPDPTSNADYRAWAENNTDKTAKDYAEQQYADREPNDLWTQDEKNRYFTLMTINPESAFQYAAEINSAINREVNERATSDFSNLFPNYDMSKEAREDRSGITNALMWAGNAASDVAGIAGGVATGPVKLFNWLDNIYQNNERGGYYAGNNTPRISDYTDKLLGQNAERLNSYGTISSDKPVLGGKGLGDLYQLVESVAQSMAYGAGLSKVFGVGATTAAGIQAAQKAAKLSTGLIFFGQAADSSYNEYIQRGMSREQAAVGSFFAGLAEAAGEEFSIDHLISGDIAEGLAKYVAKQSFIESTEEGFTNILNLFGDELAARLTGGKSKMRQDIEALKSRGMSDKDAKRQVWKEFVDETVFDMFGGAFSGGLSAGLTGGTNKLWEMRRDSVLGKQSGAHVAGKDGKAIGSKASNATDAQLEKLLVQAEKRGDLQTALFIANELINREEAGQRQRPTGDPNSTSMLAERILDGMRRKAGVIQDGDGLGETPLNDDELPPPYEEERPPMPGDEEAPPEWANRPQQEPTAGEQRNGNEPPARSDREAPPAWRNRNADLGSAQQKSAIELELDEQEAEMRQNAARAQRAAGGQITQPSQQNAAQTVKPNDSEQQDHIPTWEEYKAQNNIFLQTGMKSEKQLRADYERMLKSASTTSTESGTVRTLNLLENIPYKGDVSNLTLEERAANLAYINRQGDFLDELEKTGSYSKEEIYRAAREIQDAIGRTVGHDLLKYQEDFLWDEAERINNGGKTNAGEQAVQQPEAAAAGETDAGRPVRESGERTSDGLLGGQRTYEEGVPGQQSRESEADEGTPSFVTEQDLKTLPSENEVRPLTPQQKSSFKDALKDTNDGTEAVTRPKLGSRLHFVQNFLTKIGVDQDVLFATNRSDFVFKDERKGTHNSGKAIISADIDGLDLLPTAIHEVSHKKFFEKFGGMAAKDVVNGSYKRRMSVFTKAFMDAFDPMKALNIMNEAQNLVTKDYAYEKKYAKERGGRISAINKELTRTGRYLGADAKALVQEMEKARSLEEFANELIAWDDVFLEAVNDKLGLSYEEIANLRGKLLSALEGEGAVTPEYITAINDAVQEWQDLDGEFTDDELEFPDFGLSSDLFGDITDSDASNFAHGSWQRVESDLRSGTGDKSAEFNLNAAIRAVQNGDVESLSNYELQKVYDYITNGLPNTSNNRLTRISNQMLDAKAANRLSSNDPKTQARLDAAYIVLSEMEARGMDTKHVPARWKFVSEAHSDSEITPETSADEIVAAIRDGDIELEKDIMYGRGEWANYTVNERLDILENNPDQTYYDAGNDRIAKESAYGYDDEVTDNWNERRRRAQLAKQNGIVDDRINREDYFDDQYDSDETDTKREARWDARKGRELRDQLLKAADYERRKAKGEAKSWADAEKGANYLEGYIPSATGWVEKADISDEEYEEAKQVLRDSELYDNYTGKLKSLKNQLADLHNLADQYAGDIVGRSEDARATIRNYELAIQDYTDLMNEALESGDTNGASFYLTAADELKSMLASTREYLSYLESKYKSSKVFGDFGIFTEKIVGTRVDILNTEWALERMTQSARSLFADAERMANFAKETGNVTAQRHAEELAKQARKRKNRESWAKRAVYQHDEYGKGRYNMEDKSLPPIGEPGNNKYARGFTPEQLAEQRKWNEQQKAKAIDEEQDFEQELRKRTREREIVANETDNELRRAQGYTLDADAKGKAGIEKQAISDAVRQQNLETYQEAMRPGRLLDASAPTAKSMARLNRMFADRLGIENKGTTAGAIGTPKSFYDSDASDFGTNKGQKKTPLIVDAAYTNYAAAAQSVADLHKKIMSDIMAENPNAEPDFIDKQIEDSFLGNSVRALDTAVSQIANSKDPLGAVFNLRQQLYSAKNKGEGTYAALASDAVIGMCDEIGRLIENKTMPYDEKARAYAVATTQLVSALSTRAERLYDAAHRVQRIQDKLATVTKKDRGKLREALTGYKIMQMNPTTLFKMLDNFDVGGKGAGYEIARALENGTVKSAELIARAARQFDEAKKTEGFQEFAEGKTNARYKFKGEYTISELQAIEFILLARRMNGMKVYDVDAHGGVIEKTRLQTLKGFALRDADGNHIFVDSMYEASPGKKKRFDWYKEAESMYRNLSPAAKAYLKAVNKVMDGLGKEIRQAKINATGVGFTGMEGTGYYPISYMSDKEHLPDYNTKPDYEGLSHDKHLEGPRLTHGGYAVVQNAAPVVDRYVEWASNYAGFADIADMLQTMNVSGNGRGLVNATTDAYGAKYGKAIERYIGDVNNFTDVSREHTENSTLRALRQNMAAGVLGLSLSVPIKQVASYWDAAGILSMDSLRRAYRVKAFVKEKGLGADIMFLKSRQVGNVDPTISEMMGSGLMDNLKKRSSIVKLFAEATNRMDYKTVDNLFTATVLDVEANLPGIDKDSDLFKRAVESKFNQVVLNTQPIFNKNARSEYLRSSNEWQRLFSMFRTQQTQNFNRLIVTTMEARAAKGTSLETATKRQLRQTIAGQVAGQLEFAALTALANFAMHGWKRWRDDDDEITVESVVKRFGLDALESIAGTAWFGDEIAKMLVDGAFGTNESFGVSMGVLSSVFDTLKYFTDIMGDVAKGNPLDIFDSTRKFVGAGASVLGLPVNNLYRLANAAVMWGADALKWASKGKYGNRANYDDSMKMLDAWIKGGLKEEGAKKQAAKAFRKGQPENLLYNLGILSSLTEEDGQDKGRNYLDSLIKKSGDSDDEESKNHRIVDYLVHQAVSSDKIDKAVDQYGTSYQYNQFYDILRQNGHTPIQAVKKLDEIDSNGDNKITTDELQDYWKQHGHDPKENKLVEALFGPTADDFRIIKDTKTYETATRYYKPVVDSGVTAEVAVEIVDACKNDKGTITQELAYQYYLAHPERKAQIEALWEAKEDWKTSFANYKPKKAS